MNIKRLFMRLGVFLYTLPTHIKTTLFSLVAMVVPVLQKLPITQSAKFRIALLLHSRMLRAFRSTEQKLHDLNIRVTRERWQRAHK
jgi:hypothetical protein